MTYDRAAWLRGENGTTFEGISGFAKERCDTMSTHTPGPVTIRETDDEDTRELYTTHGPIASIDADYSAFIVRACNSHEAMLEALKELLALADMDYIDEETKPIIDRAQEAIRLAEGKA